MLKPLLKFFKLLNSETDPRQLALGVTLGMMLGLLPLANLYAILLLLLLCLLRANLSAALVTFGLITPLTYLFDGSLAQLGESLLTAPDLQATWTAAYASDLLRLTHFNHTLTLGAAVVGLVLAIPVFIMGGWLIGRYREHVLAWVNRMGLVKALKASRLFSVYETLSEKAS